MYVDLGAPSTFDRVTLSWIRRAAEGSLQVSDDAANWKTRRGPAFVGEHRRAAAAAAGEGRYVRVLMKKPAAPEGYILSEMEVFGKGGPVPQAKPSPEPSADRLDLAGGAWRVERDSLVAADGPALSKAGYPDSQIGLLPRCRARCWRAI